MIGLAGRPRSAEGERVTQGRQRVPSVLRRMLKATSYDAAQPGGPNERHWSAAGSMSARQANSPTVRETLRNRARYEVANNSLLRGMVDTLADDTIGEGPQLQVLQMSRTDAQRLEWAWHDWSDRVDFWSKMRLLRKARTVDGEVFAVMTSNPAIEGPIKLDIVLVEAERVQDPNILDTDLQNVDGIRFDAANNPVKYRVLRQHPDDDVLAQISDQFDWIDARDVIHYFRADRPGQVRGIPEITPALPNCAQLRRMTAAVLGASEAAANQALVMYTDNPVEGDSEDGVAPVAYDEIELPANTMTALPDGWKLGQVKAEQPTTTFGDFRRQIANDMGRCLSMPVNVVLADSSQHNFASGKLDHVIYGRKLKVDREELRIRVLDRIFRRWLSEASLAEGVLPQSARRREPPVRVAWTWPAFEHADPSKEAAGIKGRMETGTTNLIIECGRQGLDWQEVLEGEKEIQDYRKALGLKDPAPAAPPKAEAPVGKKQGEKEDDDDDEEGKSDENA